MFASNRHKGMTRNARRLGIERLESRQLMAVGAEMTSGILEIEGTENADVISIDTAFYSMAGTGTIPTLQLATQVTIRDRTTNELILQQRFDPLAIQDIVVWSLGGNDKVTNNTNITSSIEGGAGHDELFGGGNIDHLFGGEGHDDLYGRGGNDSLSGNGGNDDLWGGAGNDWMSGGAGYDELWGEAGNDTLIGGEHDDDLFGGDGNDCMWGDQTEPNLLIEGDDYMEGGNGNDFMEGMGGNDIMKGNNGDDTLHGWAGDDDLYGGADEDIMHGGSGYDFFETGTGVDDVYFSPFDESLDGNWAWVYAFAPNVNEGPYRGTHHWTF